MLRVTIEQIGGCLPLHGTFLLAAAATAIYETRIPTRRSGDRNSRLTWLQQLFSALCLGSACLSLTIFAKLKRPDTLGQDGVAAILCCLSFLVAASSQFFPNIHCVRGLVDFWLLAVGVVWAVVLYLAAHTEQKFPPPVSVLFLALFYIQISCIVLRTAVRLSRATNKDFIQLPTTNDNNTSCQSASFLSLGSKSTPPFSESTVPEIIEPDHVDSPETALRTVKLIDYLKLFHNRNFALCWFGETSTNIGDWLNLVGVLSVIHEMYPTHNAVYSSLALFIRLIPAAAFVGVIGPLADRVDKRIGIIVCDVIGGTCAFLFTFIKDPDYLWVLYLLIFIQASAFAMYDPLRRSLVPTLVLPRELQAATTLDSISWSTMAAVGASVGGYITSYFGTTACFLGDSMTYLLAIFLFVLLKTPPHAQQQQQQPNSPSSTTSPKLMPTTPHLPTSPKFMPTSPILNRKNFNNTTSLTQPLLPAECSTSTPHLTQKEKDLHSVLSLTPISSQLAFPSTTLRSGLRFLINNPVVLGYTFLKASGAIVWGAADVMNVKISEQFSGDATGDASSTMGLLFGAAGIGCLIGPLVAGHFVNQTQRSSLIASLLSLVIVAFGYLMNLVSPTLWPVVCGTIFRSCGTSIVWVYSTLLLQLSVPPEYQGRVFAIEMCVYTVAEGVSGMFGGIAYDHLDFTTDTVSFVMFVTGCVVSILWLFVFLKQSHLPNSIVTVSPSRVVSKSVM